MSIAALNQTLEGRNLDFFAGAPMVYHCHHFNLFLDQTIDDALGPAEGQRVRIQAAQAAARQLLQGLVAATGARTPAERLELAQDTFRAIGHGRLRIQADRTGGSAEGEFLHYSFAWREKYGELIRRHHPVDAVAAGFAAAAIEIAFGEAMHAEEHQCIAMEHARCSFRFHPSSAPRIALLSQDNIQTNAPTGGIAEERIASISAGLRQFLAGVSGDDRGLVSAFGVYVTRHLTNYYNNISYTAIDHVAGRSPALVPMLEGLLRESGQVCVFNTFGGILYSPEWDGMVGRIGGDLEEVVSSCCGIARALGFGSWAIGELSADRLVLQTGSEYESPYCTAALGRQCTGTSYFFQGAALAFMRLWQAVDWRMRPALSQDLYNEMFRTGRPTWHVEQRQTLSAGDPISQVVVTRV